MYQNFATPTEHEQASRIARRPPVSFTYGGRPFPHGFEQIGPYEYVHKDTGLAFWLEVYTYGADSSAVEWVPHFENRGASDSLIIEDIHALDHTVPYAPDAWIGYLNGTVAQITDFAYNEEKMHTFSLRSTGSRHYTPFANIGLTAGEGFVLGLGWSADWCLDCAVDPADSTVRITCGMPQTHFLLHAGEHVRQPRVMMIFWEGDRERGQNMCRRHLVLHHVPKDKHGEPYPPICCNVWGGMKTEHHKEFCEFVKNNGLKFDYYWIDAGWYGSDHETEEFQNFYTEDWAYNRGAWRVNRAVYPNGMREVSAAANDAGMKLLLWFGTYDCNAETGWYLEHPEWGSPLPEPHVIGLNPRLTQLTRINTAIPEARRWLMETIGKLMAENHVEGYREDSSLPYAGCDAPDRIGIADITAVTSLYEIWDHLLDSVPGLLIDNCGGGGARIDLETISRSYVLWRSDYNCDGSHDPIGTQLGNCGLGRFLPLVGGAAPVKPGSSYHFRSSLYGGMGYGLAHTAGYGSAEIFPDENYPIEWHRRMLEQFQKIKPLLSGDFYILADPGAATDAWCAYGFDRPDLNRGCLLAFRRQDCADDTVRLHLHLPAGTYVFENEDDEPRETRETRENRRVVVGEDGVDFTVSIDERPGAALWFYTKE